MSAKEVMLTRTGGWPGRGWPKDELVRYVPAEPLEAENARLRKLLDAAVNGPWLPHHLEMARAVLNKDTTQ